MKKKGKNTTLIAIVCLAIVGLMVLGGTNLSSMVIYGENQIYSGSTLWCGDQNYIHGALISVTDTFTCQKVVAACASGPGEFAIYRLDGSQFTYVCKTEITGIFVSWVWTDFPLETPTELTAGTYFIGAIFIPSGTYFGIAGRPLESGETSNCYGFSSVTARTDTSPPSSLPYPPPTNLNKMISVYLSGDATGVAPTPSSTSTPTPTPSPPPSSNRLIIPSLQSGKYTMRGYGGFLSGSWTTAQYKFVRVQFYSLLEADGNLVPHSNAAVGSEGGGNWAEVTTALQNIHSWGGIPDLSIWIDNIDQTVDGVPLPSYSAWVQFFTRLKTVMQQTGTTQLLFEPCWEWNGAGPVSPSHMRSCSITPTALLSAFHNIRLARDQVSAQVTMLSHILAIQGAEWNTPAKRGYMEQWFSAMQESDGVTVSLYLSSSNFDNFGDSDWGGYLNSVYTFVIAEQIAETGWSPAVYLGFSEHNLNSGAISLTDTSGSLTGQQIYDLDFSLASSKNVRLMGWWMPFSSSAATSYVNSKAAAYMSSSPPTTTPTPSSNPSVTPTPPPNQFSHPAFSSNAETKNNDLYKAGYPYIVRTFLDIQANYTIQSLNFDTTNNLMTIVIDGFSGETATFDVDIDGQSEPSIVSGAEDWSYSNGTVTLTVKFASPVTVTMFWESLSSPEPRIHDNEIFSNSNIMLAAIGVFAVISMIIILKWRKKRR